MCRHTASTIITAESTIIPKSIAPRLIRFPLSPKSLIIPKANSMLNGMTLATTSPARQFPRKSTRMNITISPPATRLWAMVFSTRFTSCVRSMKGSITTPSGRLFCICAIRSFTLRLTSWKFSPFSIIAIPATTSPSPLRVTAPKRVAEPSCTFATSPTLTGVPLTVFMGMFLMSPSDFTTPSPRM